MKRKLWAAVLLVLTLTLVCAGAALAESHSGTLGEITWEYDGDHTLTFRGEGAIPDDGGNPPWKDWSESITEVVLEEGITSITDGFVADLIGDMYQLQKFTIPASLTTIPERFFSAHFGLTSAGPIGSGCSIEYGWTETIPDNAFSYARIQTVIFPDSVRTIGRCAFCYTPLKTKVDLPASLTSMGDSAFESSQITEITIPEGCTVIRIGTFYDCESLAVVNLPSTLVTIENNAFHGNSSLTRVNFAGTDAEWKEEWTSTLGGAEIYCEFLDKGTLNDGLSWSLTKEGLLTIEGEGTMESLEVEEYPWAANLAAVKKIVVKKGVENIAASAFAQAKNLAVVRFEAPIVIDASAFSGTEPKAVWYNGLRSEWKSDFTFPLDVVYYFSGFKDGVAYKDGILFSGITGGLMYQDGLLYTGLLDKTIYIEGAAQKKSGWVQDPSTGKYYYYKKGAMVYGWLTLGKARYYLAEDGAMVTGFVDLDGDGSSGIRYFKASGAMLNVTGWKKLDGKWYYFKDGIVKTGRLTLSGKTYYLDKNGVMKTGWVKISGKWYYFASSGAMKKGWVRLSGKWYYLDPSNGAMVTNAVVDGWQLDRYGVGSKCE